MIGLGFVYGLAGLMFAGVAVLSALDPSDRRLGPALFWALIAISFLAGDRIGAFANGLLVIALGVLAGLGLMDRPARQTTTLEVRQQGAACHGWRLFLPALTIPVVAICGALLLKSALAGSAPLIDPKQGTLVSLALGALAALVLAMATLRPPPLAPAQETRRLVDTIGWAAFLPQALAALGAVFALSGVGDLVGRLIGEVVPLDSRLAATLAFTVGMAGFTVLMGNAFAAFPVMTAAIGLPVIVRKFGGDPAVMGAIGMLSGFCGTLVTPMAANFNIVPTALLELPDRWAVIRAQAPTALLMLAINSALMYVLAFRG